MKSIHNIVSTAVLSLAIIFAGTSPVSAQKAQKVGKGKAKAKIVQVTSRIVDESGNPVKGATVTSGEGAVVRNSDATGTFTISSKDNGIILIEASGYRDFILDLKSVKAPKEITLTSEKFLAGEDDFLNLADGYRQTMLENTQAISVISPEALLKYPDLNLTSAFQGQAAGLVVRSNSGGLGNAGATFYVRGLHAQGTAAIVVVDGMERSIDDITAEEIESVQVLKDAPAKLLYGPRAANGVVLITTKRGQEHKRSINVTAEYGISPRTFNPEFLEAYDYATLYNEARVNDGLAPYYSQQQLDGYMNTKGENDLYSPDVDWYSRFAGGMQTYRKAVAEFIGGNETMKYALITGYTGGSGIESVGKRNDFNRLNIRGNLDIRVNDFITVAAGVAAKMQFKSFGGLKENELFTQISTMRPNEYPLTISEEVLGLEPDKDGVPYFGGSLKWKNNIYDDMYYGGWSNNQTLASQTDLGLKFDFDKYVKGLTAEAFINLDNYSSVNSTMKKFHATYAVEPFIGSDGTVQYRYPQVRKPNNNDNIAINSQVTKRTIGARGNIGYRNTIGAHSFSGVLQFRYYMDKAVTKDQDCVTTNTTARFNYSYDSRLFAELIMGVMGSNQFNSSHRYVFTPALSLGWVALTEPYIKVRASAGMMGYDPNTDYLLYTTTWGYPGNYNLGEFNKAPLNYRTALMTYGNPEIGWITSKEANFGAEVRAFGNRFFAEANYFQEKREGGISSLNSLYSSVSGSFVTKANYTDVRNRGVELAFGWNDVALGGDFTYSLGLNMTWTRNEVLRTSEIPGIEPYRSAIGNPTSAIFALTSEGLFGKDVALDDHARQTYGDYTVGDIAYKDMNNDNVIDAGDESFIGQNFPLTVWGFNMDLIYKGFGLYALFTAETGASVMRSNSYWWNTGSDSYSVKALDRYHPVNNPDGTLPRLTTTSGSNSYQRSDFWLSDASFLRLKNVELSYTWKNQNLNSFLRQVKGFVQGTNLFVLSAVKDFDPEMPDAGITTYPAYRTIVAGVLFTF